MDHIAYLSQEIGPRPAGTEEEQQAALYITDRLQKDAHLSANIEDFACQTRPGFANLICGAVAILAVVLSIALPVTSIPAAIVALIAAAVLIAEAFDVPVISRLFTTGISQNVVGKYEPVRDSESAGARRRKVILVANYDSGKVSHELAHPLVGIRRILDIAVLAASVLIPLVILIKQLAFADAQGAAAVAFIVIKVILAVIVLVPVVFYVLKQVSNLNEAANSNAAGVAVMLEVARRLGTGEVGSSPIAEGGVMHDEYTARAAGVVPDGATVSYEAPEDGGLSAAKAAIAAMTGEVPRNRVQSIADNLVQVKDAPLAAPDEDALSKARQDTRAALASAPAGTLAEAAAKAAVLHEQAEQRAAAEAAALAQAAAAAEAEKAAAEQQQAEEERKAAEEAKPAGVPDWYKKATEKARSKAEQSGSQGDDSAQYRSRYADFPSESDVEEVHEADAQDESAAPAAPTPITVDAAQVEVVSADQAPVSHETPQTAVMEPGATTAIPPVADAGNLDLDALRAAAKGAASDVQAAPSQPAAMTAEDMSGAATTRLPQMMYYTPPEDRSAVMRDRAQKSRVTVSADGLDQAATMDAAEAGQSAAIQTPLPTPVSPYGEASASNAAPEPRVISANIPVVDLPRIELPPITAPELKPVSFEEFRQRAPLANVAEAHGQDAAKSLLATTLPTIEESDGGATVAMPALQQQEKPQNVSLTGSFSAVSAIGAKPVGDELLEGVAPEDIYVDDADDSVFDTEFTETGAFAGPGYVEMPQSRVGKFFGKFRRKKNKEEASAHEWLGVDEDFDARSVGKARGGWESFRDEEDDWQGGAFSSLRSRFGREQVEAEDEEQSHEAERESSHGRRSEAASVSADEFAAVAAMAASKAAHDGGSAAAPQSANDDVQQIYSFAAGDINTEVWFVALGSELADQGGIKAFLADHASEMRGAIIINLEALGAGDLCYLEKEGALKQVACSPRMKRFIRKATQASGVEVHPAIINWRESPASYAMKHRAQALSIVGMDGNKPAFMGEADDVIENVDEESLNRAADFVVELLKNI